MSVDVTKATTGQSPVVEVVDRTANPADVVIDAEIVDQEEVTLPERPLPALPTRAEPLPLPWQLADRERRPVVATWLRDGEQRILAARWAAGYVWHVLAFHALRVPLYLLRAALFVPRGTLRLGGRVVAWATDARSVPLILAAQKAGDAKEYRSLVNDPRNGRSRG